MLLWRRGLTFWITVSIGVGIGVGYFFPDVANELRILSQIFLRLIRTIVAPLLFDQLPCKTTKLCFDIDGTFPNHEANPLIEENRRDITEEVIRQRADVGIAWDGDADRCPPRHRRRAGRGPPRGRCRTCIRAMPAAAAPSPARTR